MNKTQHIPSTRRGFWSLILTQFQGAFSDNAFKTLVMFLVVGSELSSRGKGLVLVIGALFAIPFLLFSMTGGFLADRYSKRTVTIGTKLMEIGVMTLALVGLATDSLSLKVATVFLMSVQSALFGPAKYGLLPELLPERFLSWGNGVMGLGTFLAIITGTVTGGVLAEQFPGSHYWSGLILLSLSLGGLAASLGITRVPAADPERQFRWNFIGDLCSQWGIIRQDRVLFLSVVGNTYFYFLAALLQFNILFYGIEVLAVAETRNSLLLAAVAVGIGVGSLAAGYLSGNKIEYGLLPLGSLGLCLFAGLLSSGSTSYFQVCGLLALLGFSSGFFVVPISALIQHQPREEERGGVIAASNLLSFVGIFLASIVYYTLVVAGLSTPQIFLAGALMTLGATIYVVYLMPASLIRLLLWLLTHTVYRIRVEGRDHIPDKGGALFVCNHLSFVDVALLTASTDRFVHFMMFKDYYEHPLLRPFARMMEAIPISSQVRPREMIQALRTARNAIVEGNIVCIFAEGQITRIGQLLPFRRGLERIMKDLDAPIIPVSLGGVWGSIFSYERGRFFWKRPSRIFTPITIAFGKPLASNTPAVEVRQAVEELHSSIFQHRKEQLRPLHRAFVSTARRHPLRFAMADGRVPRLRFGGALVRTLFLARRLGPLWEDQQKVGILLPPSVAGALVNLAALLTGKIPVNLNYTASNALLASCASQCQLQTVITSRAFLDQIPIQVPGQVVLLEELAATPRSLELAIALAQALFCPTRWLERCLGGQVVSVSDLATIIFSSGSTGDPKGVMLSHFSIGANVEQLGRTFFLKKQDRILGILPFFHSFGFTGTLMLPLTLGIGVIFHPNPLDARAIGDLVLRHRVTFLLSTPTFLQAYIRRCQPEEFGSLQFVMTGAEKLPDRLAEAFEDKFGLRPLEGYGCTECSPAVSVNTRDFRAAGFRQIGAKRHTIGHPLPGVSVRIVDPETYQPLPPGEAGLMLVKGPNVMMGYLGRPEKTAEVLRDGWYVTGDIAARDLDGFLTITDRLSRFSKIGGEMVPHIKVEESLHELAGITEQTFAVTGVPDPQKGERLVVLFTLSAEELQPTLERLNQLDLPKLWIPKASQFFQVEALPYLGTGKLDLRKVKQLALEFSR